MGSYGFGNLLKGSSAPDPPQVQVLPCLAPHFADRLPLENWMIWDETHNMFAVHEASRKWVLVCGEDFAGEKFARVSDREREFARLWTGFCKTIAIDARKNPRCQRQNLPSVSGRR